MTLRITLLVLVTGLFAMIWTHDQPQPNASSRRQAALAQEPGQDQPAIAANLGASLRSDHSPELPRDDMGRENDGQMPLPIGIVPGEYRAVSNTGIVRHLSLTLQDLQTGRTTKSEFVTRDVYQSSGETCLWYFIRVQTDPNAIVPVIAERGHHIHVPAVAERSRDKLLERQASQIIVTAGQQIAERLIRIAQNRPARLSSEEAEKTRL